MWYKIQIVLNNQEGQVLFQDQGIIRIEMHVSIRLNSEWRGNEIS